MNLEIYESFGATSSNTVDEIAHSLAHAAGGEAVRRESSHAGAYCKVIIAVGEIIVSTFRPGTDDEMLFPGDHGFTRIVSVNATRGRRRDRLETSARIAAHLGTMGYNLISRRERPAP